ncbi:MAG: NAD(P)/FAD-dependent oxidoreductase [Deltaproteobacteria bacterium]|nr:NAD(P)/FAD-dependent oxidoreductase [Deltaproteobacteria bacterium]
MSRREFDVIIIGGGHHGLTLAAYLARAKVDACILEGRNEWGGALYTGEVTAPGFCHNIHANFMEFLHVMPFFSDFDLPSLGARTIYPEVQAGIAFKDGRPPVLMYRNDMIEGTAQSFARYSKNDASTWRDLKTKANQLELLMAAGLYTPPPKLKPGEPPPNPFPAFCSSFSMFGLDEELGYKSIKDCVDELFEADEIRALLYRVGIEFAGPALEWPGSAYFFLFGCILMPGCWRMIVGGTHRLSGAMVTACLKEGVTMRESSRVQRILIDGGRASGVILQDGTKLLARKAVVSAIGLKDTFLDLVGEDHLSPYYRRRVKNFKDGPDQVLGSLAMALHEPPRYKSARHDPGMDRAWYQIVGYDSAKEVLNYCRAGHVGRIPDLPAAGVWVNSLWDRTQAPEGRHSLTGWYFFPRASDLTEAQWEEVRETYNDRFLRLFAEFAPNMTRENVMADFLHTPLDQERGMRMREGDFGHGAMTVDQLMGLRPFAGCAHHATEIPGLYLAGSCTHPGGGVTAACGYNCFKVLCEDFGFEPAWRNSRRFY